MIAPTIFRCRWPMSKVQGLKVHTQFPIAFGLRTFSSRRRARGLSPHPIRKGQDHLTPHASYRSNRFAAAQRWVWVSEAACTPTTIKQVIASLHCSNQQGSTRQSWLWLRCHSSLTSEAAAHLLHGRNTRTSPLSMLTAEASFISPRTWSPILK